MENMLEIFLLAAGASFVQRTSKGRQRVCDCSRMEELCNWSWCHYYRFCHWAWTFSRIPGKIFPYVVYSYIGISGIIILISTL